MGLFFHHQLLIAGFLCCRYCFIVCLHLKGGSSLPELHEVTSFLTQCGFGNIEVRRFMPSSTFYRVVASQN
jgi:hypothetical protein